MEPVWEALETRLGKAKCVGFMFMGRLNAINRYKHGITRTYMYLDAQGNCYKQTKRGSFFLTDWVTELRRLEKCLASLGCTLTTPYDEEFITKKRNALLKKGISVLTITVDPHETNRH